MSARTVFIIESHPVLRESYAFLLDRQKDLHVDGVTACVEEALPQIEISQPDLIVVNYVADETEGRGVKGIQMLRAAAPDAPLLVVSSHAIAAHEDIVLKAGADHYLPRNRVPFEMLTCVRQILGTQSRGDRNARHPRASASPADKTAGTVAAAPEPLSRLPLDKQQQQIFQFLGLGMSREEVAEILGMTPDEVVEGRNQIMATLNLASAKDLRLVAQQWTPPDTAVMA